jgi:ABC-type uncharacterized transport system involved in gliding motility auxiliary subunit
MKEKLASMDWRRLAPVGIILAIVAALAAIGLYIVFRKFDLYVQISLGLFIIGLALFAILDPERVRRALTGRQARYGSNALILSIAFVGVVIVVNYLVYQNTKRWDLTEDKQYTLAPETVDTLKKLPSEVTARAFYPKSQASSADTARQLLEQYKVESGGKFDYLFIDPDADPITAKQYKVTQNGTIVLTMGDQQQSVRYASEQELTGGLVRLLNPEVRVVYFLTGHGEYSPDESGDTSYSTAKSTLESKNYMVKTLNLLATNQIPDDAKIIIIAGPRQPLAASEVDQIGQFMAKGGGLIVMEEPLPATQFGDSPDPLADYLASTWGIEMGKDIVVDLTSQQPFAPYASQYGSHAITTPIQRTTSQFPTARSVRAASPSGGTAAPSLVELIQTANESWAETDLKGLAEGSSNAKFDPGQDTQGPIPLAVAGENLQTKGRIVAFGDSDFAINVNFAVYANGDLFVNAVDWVAGQEDLISLTPKNTTQRLMLPPEAAKMNLILLSTVFVLPGLALVGGIVVFIQRRRRG